MTAYAPRYYLSDLTEQRWAVRRLSAGLWEVRNEDDAPASSLRIVTTVFRATYWRESIAEITLGSCAESSQIAAVGYDPATWDLVVEFKTGARYAYLDVPFDIGMKLQHIPVKGEKWSLGSFFFQVIKSHPDVYPFTRIEDAPKDAAPIAEAGEQGAMVG